MLQQLLNGLQEGSFYSLIALAVVVVMKTTDVPNFAMGDMGLVAAYLAWSLWSKDLPMGLAIAIALAFAFVFGAVIQRRRTPSGGSPSRTTWVRRSSGDWPNR